MSNLAAVIVDSRGVDAKVVDNHMAFLPDYTKLYIIRPNISTIQEYNNILTSESFWKQFKEENILIFQHDSGLLRYGIDEFYNYDYVGAPIKWIDFPAMNGGLSFRKKSAMLKVIKNFHYNGMANEDLYFCNALELRRAKLPSKEVAQSFSVETIYNLGSFGYHAMDKYLTVEQQNKIKNQYK